MHTSRDFAHFAGVSGIRVGGRLASPVGWRHSADGDRAFDILRDHSQHNGRKLVDIAQAIVDSNLLLLPSLPQPATATEPAR